ADPPAAAPEPGPSTDLVWITVDTLRADALGYAGHPFAETPTLDRLAATGVVFRDAHAHEVITLPSHASMFTGRNPPGHGVRDNAGYRLDPSIPTLAATLRERGYATAAFVSAFTLDRRYGLDRGFDVYDDRYEGHLAYDFSPAERPAEETVRLALEWWRSHEGSPRFLWVHVFTPHFPYTPPEPFASRFAESPYHGEVAAADRALDPLLSAVAAARPSPLIVFTSDHGESLGEHGEATHGVFAYEATLKVPLVIAWPGRLPAGERTDSARHVDLMPTVLRAFGLSAPEGLAGRDLFAPVPADHDTGVYFESLSPFLNRGWAPLFGRIEGRRKAIDLPEPELYALDDDPSESTNLAPRERADFVEMRRRLPPDRHDVTPPGRVDAEALARLRSLGYVAGGGAPPSDPLDEANDPKRLIALDTLLDGALAAANRGDTELAERRLAELIRRRPTMTVAYTHLAFLLGDRGAWNEAADVLRRGLAAGAGNESLHRKLALALIRLDDLTGAADVLAPFADSEDPETQSAWGRLEASRGDPSEAAMRFARALELDPTYPGARTDRGVLALMQGRTEEAIATLTASLDADPRQAEAWNALGAARARTGDLGGARDAWRRALDIDANLADACFNLARLAENAGLSNEAANYWDRYARLVDGDDRRRAEARRDALRAPAGNPRR
ncbi:MAG: sulfatase-like hydrolase/transferase, partial [Planctomycetota bacterium]|nr:sulfatase-like hydrolase/transferase [Planctomycetota bacterium]